MPEGRQFPSFDAYQAALQHPENCFYLDHLKSGQIETDLWGFPRVRSGGFALTYRVTANQNNYAVRCFHKNIHDRYQRYTAITATLYRLPHAAFIPVKYAGKGVRVGKNWFPITIMPWVDGDTLEGHIYKNLGHGRHLDDLAGKFVKLIDWLEKSQIAHGDLSHQNILVKQNELVLVDYDGMYVPSLAGKTSSENGHANFQHPGRSIHHYNSHLDRFSAIVIYMALKALAIHPDLWKKYEQSGDGLLFRKKDFIQPYESGLLQELETLNSLRKYVYIFRKICLSSFDNIPSLSEFIHLKVHDLPRDEVYIHRRYSVDRDLALDATHRYPMVNQIGKIVNVVGQVKDYFAGKGKDDQPHIYLNFGNWRAKCFTVVLWGEGYSNFLDRFPDFEQIKGQWLSVTGLLTSYNQRPQIALDTPYGLEFLPDRKEAGYRLGVELPPEEPAIIPGPLPVKYDLPAMKVVPVEDLGARPLVKTQPTVNMERVRKFDRLIQSRITELYAQPAKHTEEPAELDDAVKSMANPDPNPQDVSPKTGPAE